MTDPRTDQATAASMGACWPAAGRTTGAGCARAWLACQASFHYRVLCGPTRCGKTRLLHELRRQGDQNLELEELASQRGSSLGTLPGQLRPMQKLFDSLLPEAMRQLESERVVWLEAESKSIGNPQLPERPFETMHASHVVNIEAPMAERVRLWREDCPQFVEDPMAMVAKLEPLKPGAAGRHWRIGRNWCRLAGSTS